MISISTQYVSSGRAEIGNLYDRELRCFEVSVKKYCEGDHSFQAGECCGREL